MDPELSVDSEAPESDFDSSFSSASEAQSQGPAVEQQPQVTQEQPHSPWENFKRLPQFQGQDDQSIAARLYTAMQREEIASRALAQYQQMMPMVNEYLPHREDFQRWLSEKSRTPQSQQGQEAARLAGQQAPQQPAPKKFYDPPQVRDIYRQYLVKDENGREIIDPSAPPEARHQLMEYQKYRADFANKFLEDPEAALGPMIQEMAAKQAQEIVQKQFEIQKNESLVDKIESENRDWMIDPRTNDVSPAGVLVHKYIEEAQANGIKGPEQRWNYAVAMTERDMLARLFDEAQMAQQMMAQQQAAGFTRQPVPQQQPPAPPPQPAPQPQRQDPAAQNMQYLRREAARNPSRATGQTASNLGPQVSRSKKSFAEMLQEDASSRGLI